MKLSTTDIKRKKPINRNNLFASESQIELQYAMGMEYVNKVLNQTIVLYEIDRELTKIDDIYKEAKFNDLVFKTPVELNVMYKIDSSELKTYDTNTIKGYYVKTGKLTFNIYEKELIENSCDIKIGDYIGVQITNTHMEYFIVTNDGRNNYDNRHTMWGFKPYYRTIQCSVVTDVTETQNI
jgi:hypothetical protein